METFRRWTVVDEENMVDEDGEEKEFNPDAHLNLSQAQIKDSEASFGSVLKNKLNRLDSEGLLLRQQNKS